MRLIGIHILSQQRHLLETTVAQVAHLTEDALDITRALTTSRIGHDAVVTKVVTATHDTDEAANAGTMQTLGHHVAIGLCGRQVDIDSLMARLSLSNQVGQ